MDPITQELTSLILKTDVTRRPDLAEAGRRAFADYLASALAGSREEAVRRTAAFLATRKGERDILGFDVRTTPENAAFFNGFASHYLDFDDAEANLMGHFSTVIFSALLAIANPSDTFEDFLAGYTAGAETEGLLGKLVNPAHKKRGYHPTATIGPIGAAAAIARFRRLPLKEASELLSLGATESAGLGLGQGQTPSPSTPDLPPETPSSPTSSSATALSHRARAPSTTTTDGPPSRQERRSQKAPFPSAGFPPASSFHRASG